MNTILLVILTLIGVTYGLIAAMSTAAIICPLKNPDGSYVPDDEDMKRFLLAILLLPISPIIGPYFIYKVLKKGNKKGNKKGYKKINGKRYSYNELMNIYRFFTDCPDYYDNHLPNYAHLREVGFDEHSRECTDLVNMYNKILVSAKGDEYTTSLDKCGEQYVPN